MTLPAMCDPPSFCCLTGVLDHGRQRIYSHPIAQCDLDVLRCTGTDRQARRLGRQRRALMAIFERTATTDEAGATTSTCACPQLICAHLRDAINGTPYTGCSNADALRWDNEAQVPPQPRAMVSESLRALREFGWTVVLALVCTMPAWPVIWVSR